MTDRYADINQLPRPENRPWQSERPIFTRMVQRMTQIFASGITLIEGSYLDSFEKTTREI
ncbi:uncharacterized protein N7479_001617 [Penicillium vulpinum]|uniref:uncharacterized protein n=1 Tax=Penicillium vulpinum TaxID=29845 RepID=UPI002546A102|nr:uncharacterized protein N7479_001617 [Penicillium vulpinum]KAJ5971699.1 hypothetical protein N7479_001617 [Penicillium vulpinum]